jgi:hypothetical protein
MMECIQLVSQKEAPSLQISCSMYVQSVPVLSTLFDAFVYTGGMNLPVRVSFFVIPHSIPCFK